MRKAKEEKERLKEMEPVSKPTMAICSSCGKSINAICIDKHSRLCNYTSKSIKRRKIEKLEEITNKIDSDEKIRQNRTETSGEKE